ncbi:hypothetical protein [Wukongibacter sp. M2B1]|uniref:hypothetical protein n=1 Tax=Wukongibacter sp. M2B1 TaxID=3088895 RepID=UPI003D7B102B
MKKVTTLLLIAVLIMSSLCVALAQPKPQDQLTPANFIDYKEGGGGLKETSSAEIYVSPQNINIGGIECGQEYTKDFIIENCAVSSCKITIETNGFENISLSKTSFYLNGGNQKTITIKDKAPDYAGTFGGEIYVKYKFGSFETEEKIVYVNGYAKSNDNGNSNNNQKLKLDCKYDETKDKYILSWNEITDREVNYYSVWAYDAKGKFIVLRDKVNDTKVEFSMNDLPPYSYGSSGTRFVVKAIGTLPRQNKITELLKGDGIYTTYIQKARRARGMCGKCYIFHWATHPELGNNHDITYKIENQTHNGDYVRVANVKSSGESILFSSMYNQYLNFRVAPIYNLDSTVSVDASKYTPNGMSGNGLKPISRKKRTKIVSVGEGPSKEGYIPIKLEDGCIIYVRPWEIAELKASGYYEETIHGYDCGHI